MARAYKKKSKRRVIVELFAEHPHLLDQKNNNDALDIYEKQTGLKITDRLRQYVANVKSDIKKRGLPELDVPNGEAGPRLAPRTSLPHLDDLEQSIDHCLVEARALDHGAELRTVIDHLRAARNLLVRLIGD